jgi:hypothetical protein
MIMIEIKKTNRKMNNKKSNNLMNFITIVLFFNNIKEKYDKELSKKNDVENDVKYFIMQS